MSLRRIVNVLKENPDIGINIRLPHGEMVRPHFHITEVAKVTKEFIDCGGTLRQSEVCVLQVWVADDYTHRLNSTKLSKILSMAEKLGLNEFSPVEIEHEKDNVTSKYEIVDSELTQEGLVFVLDNKHTGCLAPDKCGVK